jgi:integrase/recombinase XerD
MHKTLEQRDVANEIFSTWRFLGKAYIPDAKKTAIVVIPARSIMGDVNELLGSFTEHMKVKNYSPATMESYGHGLKAFLAHLESLGISDIKSVSRNILDDYQLKLAENSKGYTTATLSLKLRSVKRFFEHLEDSGTILVSPAGHLKEPKRIRTLPRCILTRDEARKILDAPNLSTLIGIRDRAVLEVFYSTGIRLEEMMRLTIFDCDLQGGLLRVNKGKFAKDRVVPLGKHAVRFIKEYITKVRPHFTKRVWSTRGDRVLFLNKYGSPLSKQVTAIMVRGHAKAAGINKKVTAHVFRHTFATELVKNGADITAVQRMLGHSDLSVTHIYTRVAGTEVKKTHSQSHPREKDRAEKEEITPDITSVKGHYHHDQHE